MNACDHSPVFIQRLNGHYPAPCPWCAMNKAEALTQTVAELRAELDEFREFHSKHMPMMDRWAKILAEQEKKLAELRAERQQYRMVLAALAEAWQRTVWPSALATPPSAEEPT